MSETSAATPPEPVLLTGATASGKSAVALELARRWGAEIVSVDSMQVYRGLDIGTAKPSPAERAEICHHLVDIVDLTDSFDAARFVSLATDAIRDARTRGRPVILCGGTGMYLSAWLNGLGESPAPDPALRAKLESLPLPVLLDELARKDWTTFDEIDVQNRRRVVRAVEVIRLTGRPFSQQRARWSDRAPTMAGRCFGLERDRADEIRRIDQRVDRMFAAGLIEETRCLLERGLRGNRTAMQAIGYRQVVDHLEGRCRRQEAVELVKVRTRQFAKRQRTWFRGQLDLRWIGVDPADSPAQIADRIGAELKKPA
ncbi:MAG: transferase [Verrucomicrobiota bacterium]|jgi:tRNA dimethylallyltransferase